VFIGFFFLRSRREIVEGGKVGGELVEWGLVVILGKCSLEGKMRGWLLLGLRLLPNWDTLAKCHLNPLCIKRALPSSLVDRKDLLHGVRLSFHPFSSSVVSVSKSATTRFLSPSNPRRKLTTDSWILIYRNYREI
jgi:hypothetical protein